MKLEGMWKVLNNTMGKKSKSAKLTHKKYIEKISLTL